MLQLSKTVLLNNTSPQRANELCIFSVLKLGWEVIENDGRTVRCRRPGNDSNKVFEIEVIFEPTDKGTSAEFKGTAEIPRFDILSRRLVEFRFGRIAEMVRMASEMEKRGPTAIPTTLSEEPFEKQAGVISIIESNKPIKLKSPQIFISYRRLDSADTVGRIYDRLIEHFGADNVFKDVNSIPIGADFPSYLEDILAQCQVLVAVIGDKWLTISDESGARRLDNPGDFVRMEIETAIRRSLPIFPVLVQGAVMPSREELPEEINLLAHRNALAIRRDPDFHRDVDRLTEGIEEYINASSSKSVK